MANWTTIKYCIYLAILLNLNCLRCDETLGSSEIHYIGSVDNVGKTNTVPETKKVVAGKNGITKDKTPSHGPTKDNSANEDAESSNMVFFERKTKPKITKKSVTKPRSLLLKSTPVNSSAVSSEVGDGLDLARAYILHHRSSPSIVPSCIGNQVTLKCTAEGNPAPDLTWYKGKRPVDRDRVAEFDINVAASLFTRASHLTVTPSHKEDFDDYECSASNTLGASHQSRHKIRLMDKGRGICAEMTNDRQKYNSIIIGTVTTVGMLLGMLFIAGFVFWRVNQREADKKYQSLNKPNETEASIEDGYVDAAASTSNQDEPPPSKDSPGKEQIQDDFNAKEIGRLSSLLAADWEKLARLLGFHQHDVTAIRDGSDRVESRCAEMLNRFRKRHGSRETLAESVEELKDIETAVAIRQKYYKHNPTQ